MGRRHRRQAGGRVTPKGTHRPGDRTPRDVAPLGWDGPHPGVDEDDGTPELMADIAACLAGDEPLDMLVYVSSLISAMDPRSRSPFERGGGRDQVPTISDLVEMFAEVDVVETTAVLVAELAPDEIVAARARRAVAGRRHRLRHHDEALRLDGEAADDTAWRDVDPATARARVEEACRHGAMMFPPLESASWPAARPLVEWVARLYPDGGVAFERPEWSDADLARLTEAFFASPEGRPWDGVEDDVRDKVTEILTLCDRCCDAVLDVEHRTACRRLLALVALHGPDVLRRRGRSDTAAAAICWAIAKANGSFGTRPGDLLVKDLVGHFGLAQGSVSQRAATLIAAAGLVEDRYDVSSWDLALGDPDLLVSARRRSIIERRDS